MPDFGIFCALRCAALFKSTALSVKKTVHAGIRHGRFFGRSDGTCTHGLLDPNQTRYQLRYTPNYDIKNAAAQKLLRFWLGMMESNHHK